MTSTGARVTVSNGGSSYIMMSKLKKAIKKDVTDEVFNEVKSKYFTKATNVRRDTFSDKLINKVDQFTNEMLEYCYSVYMNDGVIELCHVLRMPLGAIRSKTKTRKVEEDNYDYLISEKNFNPKKWKEQFSSIY